MKKLFYYSFILTLLASGAQQSFAQTTSSTTPATIPGKSEYTLLEPLPCMENTGTPCKEGELIKSININGYIGYVFKFAIALAVFLATVMIIYGGFQYMLSEVPFMKLNGKEKIQNAVFGLLAALFSYLILQTIDPRLVQINTTIEPLKIRIDNDVLNFQKQLDDDFKKMGVDARNEVIEIENAIIAKEKQKQELQKKVLLTPEEYAQNDIDIIKINQEINALKAAQTQKITSGVALSEFRKSLAIINDLNAYTEDARFEDKRTGNFPLIKKSALSETTRISLNNAKVQIEQRYDDAIAQIGGKDIEKVQLLRKQKEFLTSEIDTQRIIVQNARAYKNAQSSDEAFRTTLKPVLQEKLDTARKELENPLRADVLGLKEDYKIMLEQRIDILQSTLLK